MPDQQQQQKPKNVTISRGQCSLGLQINCDATFCHCFLHQVSFTVLRYACWIWVFFLPRYFLSQAKTYGKGRSNDLWSIKKNSNRTILRMSQKGIIIFWSSVLSAEVSECTTSLYGWRTHTLTFEGSFLFV